MCLITDDQREIRRKLRVLEYAELSGDVSKTCQHFGVGRASFYRWCHAHRAHGEAGLTNNRSVPYNHPNKTPTAVDEKVLHLRRKYPASAHNLFNHERHLTPQKLSNMTAPPLWSNGDIWQLENSIVHAFLRPGKLV